jgi:micrococcal nuclease
MISRSALLTLLALSAAAPARADFRGRVVGIVDGDTIDVLRGGRPERIRLAGIDCPEKAQPYGSRARQATATLAFGADVHVLDKERDRYGRTVGEVVLGDGRSLNRELVRQGWAWWYRQYSQDRALGDLEIVARMERRGLWADLQPMPPWEWRARQHSQRYAGSGEGASGGERARWTPPARRHRGTPAWRWFRGLWRGRWSTLLPKGSAGRWMPPSRGAADLF